MDERELKHRASEADMLLRNPLLKEAINLVIEDAKNALVTCDAADTKEVMRLQSAALAAGNLEQVLREAMIAGASLLQVEPTATSEPGVI